MLSRTTTKPSLFKIYLGPHIKNVKLQEIQIMKYRMGKQEYKNATYLKSNVSTLRFEIKVTFSLGASRQIHRTFQRFKRISQCFQFLSIDKASFQHSKISLLLATIVTLTSYPFQQWSGKNILRYCFQEKSENSSYQQN